MSTMRSHNNRDSYQWMTFLEHWGFLLAVGALFLGMQVVMFFLNLTGAAWICFLAGSFALMISGACLIGHAKWPTYRSGRFMAFGIKSVPAQLASFYRWGWRLFLAGTTIALCLLLSKLGAG